MARRSKQRKKGRSLLIPAAVLLIVLGGGAFAMLRGLGGKDAFHGLTTLDASDYMENSRSFQGNVYLVEGRVEDQLRWTPAGRMIEVVTDDEPLGLLVPQDFSDQNIQPGQSFAFKVRVEGKGVLRVEALKKA